MTNITEFYTEFYSEVLKTESLSDQPNHEDCFTNIMFEYLTAIDEVEDAIICNFKDIGIQINGFFLSEDKTMLDIYVSIFNETSELVNVNKSDVMSALNRGLNFYRKSIAGLSGKMEKGSDAYSCSELISKYKSTITDVRIIAISNGLIKGIDLASIKMFNAVIKYQVWDMDRLFKSYSSTQKREVVVVDFAKYLGKPLTAICGGVFKKTNVYLSVLPGGFLADLYEEYGAKLLERNVRSFLQFKGNVNKGIRETLIKEPDMFLAYNNGITVTAESIDLEKNTDGSVSIKSITDMQIVNGGQTTVSIFKAKKDNSIEIDFSKVFVQMKLTVISEASDMDTIVPKISLYSNNQNKVQNADFSSNDPYHRKMEEISRNMWTTPVHGEKPINWFYERARGQYLDKLSLETTPLKRKNYKEEHPLITKTDLAKVLCAWDMLPDVVSLGAQKCFTRFTEDLKKKPIIPSKNYYQHVIAKVILFKKIEKIVLAQKFGGYKANIVAHTYYKLMLLTGQRINLDYIWKNQDVSPAMEEAITEICKLVQHHLVYESVGANVSEYSKTNKCKEAIENKIKYTLSDELTSELLDKIQEDDFSEEDESMEELTVEEKKTIEETKKIVPQQWKDLIQWGKANNEFAPWQTSLLFNLSTLIERGKAVPIGQAQQAMELFDYATEKGFKLE